MTALRVRYSGLRAEAEPLKTYPDVDLFVDRLLAEPVPTAAKLTLDPSIIRGGMIHPPGPGGLLVGANRGMGILTIQMPTGEFYAKGASAKGSARLVYQFLGRKIELPPDAEVPLDAVRKVIKDFLINSGGRVPPMVQWAKRYANPKTNWSGLGI